MLTVSLSLSLTPYITCMAELQPSGDPLLGLPAVGLAGSVYHCVVTWLLLHLISLQIPAYLISISGSKIGFMRTSRNQAELVIYLCH